jgi:hypothetical protein
VPGQPTALTSNRLVPSERSTVRSRRTPADRSDRPSKTSPGGLRFPSTQLVHTGRPDQRADKPTSARHQRRITPLRRNALHTSYHGCTAEHSSRRTPIASRRLPRNSRRRLEPFRPKSSCRKQPEFALACMLDEPAKAHRRFAHPVYQRSVKPEFSPAGLGWVCVAAHSRFRPSCNRHRPGKPLWVRSGWIGFASRSKPIQCQTSVLRECPRGY